MTLPRIRWSWAVDWLLLPLGAWFAVGILALFCWHCVGCSAFRPALPPISPGAISHPPAPTIENFGTIAWIASLCVALGALATIASFVPLIGPFVPRRAGLAAIAVGVGLYFLRDFMVHWLPWIRWGVLGLAVIGVVPFVVMYVRWWLDRLGKRLVTTDPNAGVALMSAARGWVKDTIDHKLKRKDLLASAKGAA